MPKGITQLTDLEVYEVSLVDRGAIGEEFTLIKSEDEDNIDIEKVLRQVDGKWFVYNHTGKKKLAGPFSDREEALHRMRQIEWFKNNPEVKKSIKQVDNEYFIYNDSNNAILAGPFSTSEEADDFQESLTEVSDTEEELNSPLGNTIEKKQDLEKLVSKLDTITISDFMSIMSNMMHKYNSINSRVNKGGSKSMNPDEIKGLVAEVVGTAMDTVNKNFVAVNKAIDEIQQKVCDPKNMDDKAKKAEDTTDEVTKSINVIGESVKGLADSVSAITKSLVEVSEKVSKLSEAKIDETIADVSKRLEAIEKQENPSNDASGKEDVNKNTGDKKEVIWKSFAPKSE